jgi:predicted methyltransferase
MGGSQAGWVMPMVAETGEVAFTVTLSGGATELSLEGKFSNWAQEDGSGGKTIDEVLVRLRRHKPSDYDFRPHFRAQKVPGLWLYGGLDRSNPSALCIELIEEIRDENGNDFTVAFFPQGNHGLWQARVGGAAENGALGSMVPGLHRTIGDWLDEKGFGPRGRAASQASAQLSRAVLADPGRPGNEREQDEARKPLKLYDWLGIRPGMAVADMWPGGGYNAHLLSLLLGEQGRVVAVWDWYGTDVFGPDYNKRPEFQARVDQLGLANMTMAAEFSDVPDNSIDVALTVRNYHDLWMVEDWKPLSFVREIYRFVKPGGVVGVVEVATPHEGFHKDTHRLNEQTVVDHFTSVGFELAGRSNMLANPDDDHTTQGFPNRHLADQYVLKFRKPVSEDLTVAKDGNLLTTQ